MPYFKKESLETLRNRIDLVEVLSNHIDLKKSGAAYKGLCPFHDEKTPSFTVNKGERFYHCFGCGAHGDAIQFLMTHVRMSFNDAVETLAERFQVRLEVSEVEEKKGLEKNALKEALEIACRFYQFTLLHTEEGHEALKYLYSRGISLEFIYQFRIGLAPKEGGRLRRILNKKFIKDEVLEQAGLIVAAKTGSWRDFFSDRITFPISDSMGNVIGFSARKYKEDTFGGKYVNTPETALFKKSRVLFGLNYSRKRIAKERKAIIVEGQIDALRLIHLGFNITVAGQGTAFGENHVRELCSLGLSQVYLALDSDKAGKEATNKIGDFFQREGVNVHVIEMPEGEDPDSFLRKKGAEAFSELMQASIPYLNFLVKSHSSLYSLDSPAAKNELVQKLVKQIRGWSHDVMVHESLRKLAHLVQVPEDLVGVGQEYYPNIYIKKAASVGLQTIDPDRILESDFLRWLLFSKGAGFDFLQVAQQNVKVEDLQVLPCKQLYEVFFKSPNPLDLLSLGMELDQEGQDLLAELLQKKINIEKKETLFVQAVQKILDRNWMKKREEIRIRIQSGQCSDAEVFQLAFQFDELKKSQPKVLLNLPY